MSAYDIIKIRAYEAAEIAAEISNDESIRRGFRDIYDFLMSDASDNKLYVFLASIINIFTVGERKTLLNGLAAEYAGVDSWLTFSDRAKRRDQRESRCHVQH